MTLQIGVARTGPPVGPAEFRVVSRQVFDIVTGVPSAVEGDDYLPVDQVLAWGDGENDTKQVSFTILDDDLIERPESFELVLQYVSGTASLGAPLPFTVDIRDDEDILLVDGFED